MKIIVRFTFISVALFILSCSDEGVFKLEQTNRKVNSSSKPSPSNITGPVTIGTQVWTTTNLNVSHYQNGDVIPEINDPEVWKNLTTGAYCKSQCDNSTKLYNWYAVTDPRGLAPQGWHIPTIYEVSTLANYLGGIMQAGNKLKGQSPRWYPVNPNITNSSGFCGLPQGGRLAEANGWYSCSSFGIWWTSSEFESEARTFFLQSYTTYLHNNVAKDRREGFTIRLIKD